MENRAHALVAGLFTLLLLAGVVVSVWWLSGSREATKDILLVAKGRVNGLSIQSQVRFRGLRVGKVLTISIEPQQPHRILVLVQVSRDVPITTHSSAQLNTMGVTGLSFVQLDDDGDAGQPRPPGPDGLPRLDLEPSNVEALGESATELSSHLNDLAGKLNRFLSAANLARLDRTLAHLEGMSAGLEATWKQTPQLVADLRGALDGESLRHLKSALANLDKAGAEAAPLMADARRTLSRLEGLSRRLDELGSEAGGEVNAATLPRLNVLAQEMAAGSRELSRLLADLRRSPQSLIVGRPAPAPGPGEPGFVSDR